MRSSECLPHYRWTYPIGRYSELPGIIGVLPNAEGTVESGVWPGARAGGLLSPITQNHVDN